MPSCPRRPFWSRASARPQLVEILAYGEHWSPDLIVVGEGGSGPGRLLGRARPPGGCAYDVDVWDASAFYVLWREHQAVYVGKATEERKLGPRLLEHLAEDRCDGWDSFSWCSVSMPGQNGTPSSDTVPGSLVLGSGRPGPSAPGSLSGAVLVEQRPVTRT